MNDALHAPHTFASYLIGRIARPLATALATVSQACLLLQRFGSLMLDAWMRFFPLKQQNRIRMSDWSKCSQMLIPRIFCLCPGGRLHLIGPRAENQTSVRPLPLPLPANVSAQRSALAVHCLEKEAAAVRGIIYIDG